MTEVVNLIYAMQALGIKDAEDLIKKVVTGKPGRLEVRDQKNPARVLGSLKTPDIGPDAGRVWSVQVPHPMSTYWDRLPTYSPQRVQVARFELRLTTAADWSVKWDILTCEPLEKLMKLYDFFLPGETETQARERRYRA